MNCEEVEWKQEPSAKVYFVSALAVLAYMYYAPECRTHVQLGKFSFCVAFLRFGQCSISLLPLPRGTFSDGNVIHKSLPACIRLLI